MNHEMHLDKVYYDRIMNNEKKIEYRVNDEKRRKMKVGDTITFYLRPENIEFIKARIIDLKYYNNLFDMYSDSFNIYMCKYYKTPQAAVDDTVYYSDEETNKYGCVAIFFEKIV